MNFTFHSLGVYLRFRMRQLGRVLYSAGWPGLLALPLLVIFGLQGMEAAAQVPGWGILIVLGLLIFSWHSRRKDGHFLKRTGFSVGMVLGVEYGVVSGLVVLPIAWYTTNWWLMPAAVIGAFIFGFIPVWTLEQPKLLPVIGRLVPNVVFEWRSALRRYGLLFILLWVLSLTAFYGMAILLVVLLLWASFLPSVFEYQEPREVTIAVVVKGGGLFRHWLRHFGLQVLAFAPGLSLHLIFHPAYWYLALIGLSFMALMLAFAMSYKYATWQSGRQRVTQGLPVTLAYFSLFFPLLLPAVGFYLLRFIKRARHHFKRAYYA